jgi:hypothetical protein
VIFAPKATNKASMSAQAIRAFTGVEKISLKVSRCFCLIENIVLLIDTIVNVVIELSVEMHGQIKRSPITILAIAFANLGYNADNLHEQKYAHKGVFQWKPHFKFENGAF